MPLTTQQTADDFATSTQTSPARDGDVQTVAAIPGEEILVDDWYVSASGAFDTANPLPGVDDAIAAGASCAVVQVEGGDVRWAKGTPTDVQGFVLAADTVTSFAYSTGTGSDLANLAFIKAAGDPILTVRYEA